MLNFAKVAQGCFIEWDLAFEHEGRRARVNSSTCVEDLGQVNLVVTDKTGTVSCSNTKQV